MRLALLLIGTLALIATSAAADPPANQSPDQPSAFVPRPVAAPTFAPQHLEVRAFQLHFADAEETGRMLKELGYAGKIMSDNRRNMLIVQDIKPVLQQLSQLIKLIDRPSDEALTLPATRRRDKDRDRGTPVPEVATKPAFASAESTPENIRTLRQAYQERDAQAARTAALIAQLGSESPEAQRLQLMRELSQQVELAYDARRELQEAEVNWLRQRLARIERQIADRDQSKNQIIDRRIQELVNPNVQWDPSKQQAAEGNVGANTNVASAEKENQNRNNLKQLALAMHNYHDVFGHFPKAVATGKDVAREISRVLRSFSFASPPSGDVPHSWRVDLLPYLKGGSELYGQYHMDEPWDSPNNKKILAQMPAVFRDPYDDPQSTNSSYYVLVGPGTVFETRPKGVSISEIVDGTSNTILIVEAKRNIPWTKPEDIPFDPSKPVPDLGGFVDDKFTAALADGSVHVFDKAQVKDILKSMIIRNDSQPIRAPE